MQPLSVAEILEALREATIQVDADGFTSHELARALHVTQDSAQQRLRDLNRLGKLSYAGKKQATSIDGRLYLAPAYRLNP